MKEYTEEQLLIMFRHAIEWAQMSVKELHALVPILRENGVLGDPATLAGAYSVRDAAGELGELAAVIIAEAAE